MSDVKYDTLDHIEGREAIRRVPGMYIGSLGSAGYSHMLHEVIDNSVDEALGGYCTRIEVRLEKDGAVSVSDNGRGIPVSKNGKGVSSLATAFQIHAGGKFLNEDGSQGAYKRSGGLHGVGIAIVAALSDRAECTSYRDGYEHTVFFRKGVYGVFDGDGKDASFAKKSETFLTRKKDSRPQAEKKANPTGTTLKFWVDHEFMDSDEDEMGNILKSVIDESALADRLEDTSYLVPGLEIVFIDERNESASKKIFCNPGGVDDLVNSMKQAGAVSDVHTFSGESRYVTRGETKDLSVDVSLMWENSNQAHHRSFVNIIRTSEGGTHEAGFMAGLLESAREAVKARGVAKAKDPVIEAEDISEGLVFVVSVSLPRPAYAGQTKTKLTETPVRNAVKTMTRESMDEWFKGRGSLRVLEKIQSAARARRARDAKFSIKDVVAEPDKKTVLGLMPANLKDCVTHGAGGGSELFIVEGESALGSLLTSRNSEFQAVFPLRGKPLNVYGMAPEKLFIPPERKSNKTHADKVARAKRAKFVDAGHLLLQNREFDNLVRILGTGFGQSVDMSKRRFDRVCIATDADVDGLHISSILFVFFYLYLRPWVEEGRLFVTQPPLYVIEYGKKSSPKQVFALNANERDEILANLKENKEKVLNVGRRKGLGESTAAEMKEALMNPKTRILKQVNFDDVTKVAEMFGLLFGSDTQARKEWIASPRTQEMVKG